MSGLFLAAACNSGNGSTGGSGGTAGTGGASGATGCVARTAVAAMKLGWNLGDSLDVVDSSKSDTTVETAWNNPLVTPALFQAVKAAGFGAVRVPVSWSGRFGAAPAYAINEPFIARVEEVTKEALDQGLYVIINIHHDGSDGLPGRWLTLVDDAGQVTATHTAAVLAQFGALWAQIAARFQSQGDHLIFESMNEVLVDYDPPMTSYYGVINALNQAFVDTVRASGGNNAERCLVVPGYDTNIEYTVAGFTAPRDSASGKLILSAHYYDPYNFTGAATTHTWGAGSAGADSWGQEDWVTWELGKLESTYGEKGLPVILGEYGACQQDGYENYRRYYLEYVTKAAHDAGIVPFLWDNGLLGSGRDTFGLFNRSDNSVQYPSVLEALLRAVSSPYTLADVAKP